jgi:hypothetical protein
MKGSLPGKQPDPVAAPGEGAGGRALLYELPTVDSLDLNVQSIF